MKNAWKYALLFAAAAGAVALIVWGGRLYRASQDPIKAFEGRGNTPRPTENITSSPQPTAVVRPEETPQSGMEQETGQSGSGAGQEEQENPGAWFEMSGDIVGLVLLGIDSNEVREEQNMGYRSDSIAVCAINVVDNTCTLITVPRDTRVKIRKLDKNGEVVTSRYDKINAAFAYGGGPDKFGHENALYALSNLLGVDLQYYASLNMDAIIPLTEAVGGVPVTLEQDMKGIGKAGETVVLHGETAYQFVRRRKGITGGSDVARTARQRDYLKGLAMRVKEMGAVAAVPSLLGALGNNARTNLSMEQMLALATVLSRMEDNALKMQCIPGRSKTIDGASYYISDPEGTRALARQAFGGAGE